MRSTGERPTGCGLRGSVAEGADGRRQKTRLEELAVRVAKQQLSRAGEPMTVMAPREVHFLPCPCKLWWGLGLREHRFLFVLKSDELSNAAAVV